MAVLLASGSLSALTASCPLDSLPVDVLVHVIAAFLDVASLQRVCMSSHRLNEVFDRHCGLWPAILRFHATYLPSFVQSTASGLVQGRVKEENCRGLLFSLAGCRGVGNFAAVKRIRQKMPLFACRVISTPAQSARRSGSRK